MIKKILSVLLFSIVSFSSAGNAQGLLEQARKDREAEQTRLMMEQDKKSLNSKNTTQKKYTEDDLRARGLIFKCTDGDIEKQLNQKSFDAFYVMIDDDVVLASLARDAFARPIPGRYEIQIHGKLVRKANITQFLVYSWMSERHHLVWEYDESSRLLAYRDFSKVTSSTCTIQKWRG